MNWPSSDSWDPAVRCIFTGKLTRFKNKLALVRFFSQDTLLRCAPLGNSRVVRLGQGLFFRKLTRFYFSLYFHLRDFYSGHASHEGLLNLTRVHWISRGYTEYHEGLNISRVGITSWDYNKTKAGYHRKTREGKGGKYLERDLWRKVWLSKNIWFTFDNLL